MTSDSGSPTRRRGMAMKMFGSGIFAVAAVIAFVTWVNVGQLKDAQSVADANGNMHVLQDYFRTHRYLGTWAVFTNEGWTQTSSLSSKHHQKRSMPSRRPARSRGALVTAGLVPV